MSASGLSSPVGVIEQRGRWQHRQPVYLLDVNVLIALLDPVHNCHQRAHAWFADCVDSWASCAITQNGYVRIVSQSHYPNASASPAESAELLGDLCAHLGHQFWSCDLSLLDCEAIDRERLLTASQVTDTYLLALAVKHGGLLATFDKRLVADAVRGGRQALHVI